VFSPRRTDEIDSGECVHVNSCFTELTEDALEHVGDSTIQIFNGHPHSSSDIKESVGFASPI
ncbi:hypothetical protein A2U01_0022560, partial [Trifolium medium]|nr:hypothetical protein [Trifolium medium]